MDNLIKLMRSKHIKELKDNLTYDVIGLIASVPIGIFFLSVIFQLIKDLVIRQCHSVKADLISSC